MIEATSLSRNYAKLRAVDDVSFSIEDGQVVGLLGHNGAGKTTIMKMLTGYLEPSGGQVLVDGFDMAMTLQIHHALADGLHVAGFFQACEDALASIA